MAINVEMPFYKAQQQMAAYRNNMPLNLPIKEVDNVPPDSPNIFVDGVSFGVSGDASQQRPLVRHVLVKDLNKIMARMKLERPKLGVFSNKAPMGLYALFDGLSTAGVFACSVHLLSLVVAFVHDVCWVFLSFQRPTPGAGC
eukprot:TRINITY_DN36401_c0_g1_i2.p1 TRINITY_DN36401_c0_g1~~TRINITY_DN36401_c0_g1_i2.p1  ORF type:complete len:142 (+),score=28.83 TRINITY_DN36401_c0_g1_i2:168-593(+)